MSIKLSVVIPCLNEGEGLLKLLQDLQYLRHQGHQLILVDGGSEPPLSTALQSYVDRFQISPPGRAIQMNSGAAMADGDLLWFLHADSQIKPGIESAILTIADSDALWGRFDVRFNGTHPLLRVVAWMMNWRSRMTAIVTGDQGLFVQKQLFESVGGFPQQPLMEDIEISRRLKRIAAPNCLRERLTTSSRRWESAGIVSTILLMWGLRFAYWLGVSPTRLAGFYRSHGH
ncbi:MAG: TIGR04283 family arsenosugar biosynthesis glycosyltransferase [Candidatus Thiodiazotropha sp. 6PLUC2]